MNLKGQWALVTGAAKRIGRSIALEFARHGCHVFLHYHQSKKEAFETADRIRSLGRQAEAFTLDLTDTGSVCRWIKNHPAILEKTGILIHSASLFFPTDIDSDSEKTNSLDAIHRKSPLMLSRAFAQSGQKQRARCIINITDAMIENPYSGYADYFISKAALQEQTRTLSIEYAPHTRVNAVAPGCILFPDNYDDSRKEDLLNGVPLKREGTPEDIANACIFLAQQEYITGQTLKVDGGRSLI